MSKLKSQYRSLFFVLYSLSALIFAALTLPSCQSPAEPPAPKVDESDIAGFVGNAACAECHKQEALEHKGAHHDLTLRPMTRAELGDLAPPAGPIPDSNNVLVEQDGALYFEVNVADKPDKYQLWPLDLAFGAGKHGITPVHMLEGRNVTEMKRTYFPLEKRWRVTPGKKINDPAVGTEIHTLERSRACIDCHSIAMSKNTFVPRREFFGVGCESCHGPGRAHIETVRAGRVGGMEPLQKKSAEQINTLCGRCHTLEKDVANNPVRQKMTYRFHSYGVMTSPCYLKSGKQLSCLNCHDSHKNVAEGAAAYTPSCLVCHSGAKSPAHTAKSVPGKICPVNATSDCTKCHMPKRDYNYATNEVYGIQMTEHRIGIYKDVSTTAAAHSAPAPSP